MDYSPSDSFPHLFCSGNDVKSFFSFILLTILLQLLFLLFKLTPFRFLCLWTWNLDETWMTWSFLLQGKQNTITYSLLICLKFSPSSFPGCIFLFLENFPSFGVFLENFWGAFFPAPWNFFPSLLNLFPSPLNLFPAASNFFPLPVLCGLKGCFPDLPKALPLGFPVYKGQSRELFHW